MAGSVTLVVFKTAEIDLLALVADRLENCMTKPDSNRVAIVVVSEETARCAIADGTLDPRRAIVGRGFVDYPVTIDGMRVFVRANPYAMQLVTFYDNKGNIIPYV